MAAFSSLQGTQWGIYFIMQADGHLAPFAQKALQEIGNFQNDNYIIVDLIKKETVERHIFDKEHTVKTFSVNDTLIELLKTGCRSVCEIDAQKTMLIFSGHATGILEPVFNGKEWVYEPDKGDSVFTRYGLQQADATYDHILKSLQWKSFFLSHNTRAISHRQLIEIVRYAAACTQNKKIDIVGFDACHMALLEVAYDLKSLAKYCIASQGFVEQDGWNYAHLMATLNAHKELDEIVRQLVFGHERWSRMKNRPYYCLSAFDLRYTDTVVQSFDAVIACIEKILESENQARQIMQALCAARQKVGLFSKLSYSDLTLFLEDLLVNIDQIRATPKIIELRRALLDTMYSLQLFITAHGAGNESLTKGCSIYFPLAHIDSTYINSFARDHRWLDFLNNTIMRF